MKFPYVLFGATIGSLVGGSGAYFAVSSATHGRDLGFALGVMILCPMVMCIGAVLGIQLALQFWRTALKIGDVSARRYLTYKILGSVVVSLCLIAGLIWSGVRCCVPPSDRELVANFQQHRSEFERVVEMLGDDRSLIRVGDNLMNPPDPQVAGVSSTRISLYRQLLQSAHIPNGFLSSEQGNEVEFFYWSTGSSISSNLDKGYVYLVEPPTHLLHHLDRYQPDGPVPSISYRHIEGNWYLFCQYLPG